MYFPILNGERLRSPESSKSKGRKTAVVAITLAKPHTSFQKGLPTSTRSERRVGQTEAGLMVRNKVMWGHGFLQSAVQNYL